MTEFGGLLAIALHLMTIITCSKSCDLAHPAVFDALFYLNTHPGLEDAGLDTPELAANHWCSHGIREGRQATSSFHTQQYLENYPELQDVIGDDYEAAIIHYIDVGREEGRLGYKEGGGHGR